MGEDGLMSTVLPEDVVVDILADRLQVCPFIAFIFFLIFYSFTHISGFHRSVFPIVLVCFGGFGGNNVKNCKFKNCKLWQYVNSI